MKGRYIGDAIRNIQDIMEYTKKKKLNGILLFIDFEKAFDTIEWSFLWKMLEKYNFGNDLIKWVKILYKNITSTVMNNGSSSGYFKLERGVRQGDPLSPYLFILAIELLAIKLRDDKGIIGIKIDRIEQKLSLYADDMTIVLSDIKSAENAFSIFKLFSQISGLKMNIDKTEGMWLGSQRGCQRQPLDILWPSRPIKALGIYHSYDSKSCIKANFEDKIDQLIKQLHWWKARALSFVGKILVVKALGISKFSLLASLIHVPDEIVRQVNTIIYNFVWNGKTDKVKRKILIQDIDMGGLKMIDFDNYIKAAKVKWIQFYLNSEDASWKNTFEYFCGKENLGVFLRSNFALKELPKDLPEYYLDSLKNWHFLRKKQKPPNTYDFIWYNETFKINNSTVYNHRLFQIGIWSIKDLYSNNILIPFQEWKKRGAKCVDFMCWRGMINVLRNHKNLLVPDGNIMFNTGLINNIGTPKRIENITQKELRQSFNRLDYLSLKPSEYKAKIKTTNIHGEIADSDWKEIYNVAQLDIVDNYTKDLQYKILYRFLPTNKLLFKMQKVASPNCTFCEIEPESLEHLFFNCQITKHFWLEVFIRWNFVNEIKIQPNVKDIILGKYGDKNVERDFVNLIILAGKAFIWSCKQNVKELNVPRFQNMVSHTAKQYCCTDNQGPIVSFCECNMN